MNTIRIIAEPLEPVLERDELVVEQLERALDREQILERERIERSGSRDGLPAIPKSVTQLLDRPAAEVHVGEVRRSVRIETADPADPGVDLAEALHERAAVMGVAYATERRIRIGDGDAHEHPPSLDQRNSEPTRVDVQPSQRAAKVLGRNRDRRRGHGQSLADAQPTQLPSHAQHDPHEHVAGEQETKDPGHGSLPSMAGTHAGVSTTLQAWYGRPFMRTRPAASMAAFGFARMATLRAAMTLGASVVLGAGLGCGPRGDTATQSGQASIELIDCGAGIAELECGVLEVEENREAPNGRTLPITFVVARSSSRSPEADPVFLLAGGPGQGAAALAPMILHKFEAIRRERDLVFVDVRGTGSSAALPCDVEDPEDLAQVLGASFDLDGLAKCLAGYRATDEGPDLRQYTSAAMADDLDQVRAALGYEQVNLLGISYGTALAQVWMRRHGDHIRSAVLDGAVPLDLEILLQIPANAERALARVLADCREDRECDASFPGLERKLAQVLDDLDSNRKLEEFVHPRSGERTRVDITRAGFVQVLTAVLYSGNTTTLLPLLIERAYEGDYAPVAAMALSKASLSKTISMGLYLSVACAEQLYGIDENSRRAAVAKLEVFDDHALAQLEQACAHWPHAELPPAELEPVHSEVPTLVLSGRYDPVTPAEYGDHLAASFTNVRHVTVEQASHGIWHLGCGPKVIAGFFSNPEPAAVDAACFDTLARARVFLTPNGPLPAPSSEPQPEHPAATELAQGELVERN